jgi:hypothetical protein
MVPMPYRISPHTRLSFSCGAIGASEALLRNLDNQHS